MIFFWKIEKKLNCNFPTVFSYQKIKLVIFVFGIFGWKIIAVNLENIHKKAIHIFASLSQAKKFGKDFCKDTSCQI